MAESAQLSCRVLLANPVKEIGLQLATWLREAGCDIMLEEEGSTVLKTIQQRPVDLAILDLALPGVAVLELLPQVRRVPEGFAILVTGPLSAGYMADLVHQQGANGYLTLPTSREQFFDAVEKARKDHSLRTEPTPTSGSMPLDQPGETRSSGPSNEPAATSPSPGEGSGERFSVLLVEDNTKVRFVIREVLLQSGYQVKDAESSEEALRFCEGVEQPIHLLLTDVLLPGMTGPQLFEQLVQRWPKMKVLFLSGLAACEIVSRGMLTADTPLLEKPFTPTVLLAKITEVLGTSSPGP